MGSRDSPRYEELVGEGRLSSRLYTDPAVFEEELERIWYGGWVYVGHESEIPEPGDYVTRLIGRQPVIMSRDTGGRINALLNRCPHRGNTVCQYETGNSSAFRCAYHGWTFANDGRLIGATYASGYGPSFSKEDFCMARMARLETYRGFVFGSFDPAGISLEEHLGRARGYLDRFCDLSPVGRVTLNTGVLKTRFDANWKMILDNAVDGYHPLFLHRGFLKAYRREGVDPSAVYADESPTVQRDLGMGHAMLDFSEQNRTGSLTEMGRGDGDSARRQYVRALEERLGRERAHELIATDLSNVVIYPNLMLVYYDVRVVQPLSVDRSIVHNWPALLEGAPDLVNLDRLRREVVSYGPAGLVTSDDMEVMERTQRALAAEAPNTLQLSRGAWREQTDSEGNVTGRATDEVGHRGIWRRYREVMAGPRDES